MPKMRIGGRVTYYHHIQTTLGQKGGTYFNQLVNAKGNPISTAGYSQKVQQAQVPFTMYPSPVQTPTQQTQSATPPATNQNVPAPPPMTTSADLSAINVQDGVFVDMSHAEANIVRNAYNANYLGNTNDARKTYIADDAKYRSDGFSTSQALNYKLDNGLKLDVDDRDTVYNLRRGMHPLGQNAMLYRAGHADVIEALGVKNYSTMTEAQLQKKLIGTSWTSKSFGSASYDLSKNIFRKDGANINADGREVYINIKAPADTRIMFGEKKQAETILDIGTQYKVTGVHYYKKNGRQVMSSPRNRNGSYPVVILDVEIIT